MDLDPITTCDPLPSFHLTARIAERFRLWRERRRWMREMSAAAALGRIDDVLADVELTRAELDHLVDGPLDAGRQLDTLADMAGIDVHRCDPAALREATWKCVHCECREPCKRWLRDGVWRGGVDTRCPNVAFLTRH